MLIGAFRHSVTLSGGPLTRTPDGDGGYTETLTALVPAAVFASIEPATPRDLERRVGNTVAATVTHVVTIRYLPGVTTQMRITFGTRVFYVHGVQNVDERNITLVLACEEITT